MQQKTNNKTTAVDYLEAFYESDEIVLHMVYEKHFRTVESFVKNNNGTSEHAKDVYQEAFLAVWRNVQLNKFTPEDESSLSKYLFRIAKNKWMDYLRSNHYKKNNSVQEWKMEIAEEIQTDDSAFIIKVRTHFKLLGKDCRSLLADFYFKNESLKTIAQKFNWTPATAKNNKYRCLKKLREMINNNP